MGPRRFLHALWGGADLGERARVQPHVPDHEPSTVHELHSDVRDQSRARADHMADWAASRVNVIPIHARVEEARTLADDLGNFLSTADLSSLDSWDRFVAERLIERFNERTWSPCRG